MKRRLIIGSILAVVTVTAIAASSFAGGNGVFEFYSPSNEQVKMDRVKAESIYNKTATVLSFTAGDPTVQLLAQKRSGKTLWVVNDPGICQIRMEPDTGKATWIFNNKGYSALDEKHESPQDTLTTEDAMAKVAQYDQELGLQLPGTSPSVAFTTYPGGRAGTDVFRLRWQRTLNGVSFKDDWTRLTLDAESGALLSYNDKTWSDAPSSTVPQINSNKAGDSIVDLMSSNGFTMKGTPHLLIVNPNYHWTPSSVESAGPTTRLAWVFEFTRPDSFGKQDAGYGEIWVDAINGKLLGGENTTN